MRPERVQLQRQVEPPVQHRAPSVPDLIISATAELAELTVLDCDKDFDLIASVTGQPTEWLNAI